MKSYHTEPLKLAVGKEYNLNNVQEIKVTEEFLGMNKKVTDCQNTESYDSCKTRQYISTMMKECQCLPFSISLSNEVDFYYY